jgi:uncharacterized protein
VSAVETVIESDGHQLAACFSRPSTLARVPALVLAHGFPSSPRSGEEVGAFYANLADRLTRETGWAVMTFNFRGTGGSDGDFSPTGWLADLRTAVDLVEAREDISGTWLAGSNVSGALAVCLAGADPRIRGVATLSAPASLTRWASDPDALLAHARELGVVRTAGWPEDPSEWAAGFSTLDPLAAAAAVVPRPHLVIHGSDDDVVSLADARAYVAASGGNAELRVVRSAGHRLRHDPRSIATLIGWLLQVAG